MALKIDPSAGWSARGLHFASLVPDGNNPSIMVCKKHRDPYRNDAPPDTAEDLSRPLYQDKPGTQSGYVTDGNFSSYEFYLDGETDL